MFKWLACYGFLFASIVQAQVLVAWDVAGIDLDDGTHVPPYRVSAHTTAVAVASGRLELAQNVSGTTSLGMYGFKISADDEQTTLSGAIAQEHYIELSLAAAPWHVLNLQSLRINGESTSTGCDDIAILSNADGFTADRAIAALGGISGVTGGFDTDSSGFGGPIDLSDAKFSGRRQIVIRIYGWNSTSGSGSTRIRNLTGYDLLLEGTAQYSPPTGTVVILR